MSKHSKKAQHRNRVVEECKALRFNPGKLFEEVKNLLRAALRIFK